MTKPHGVELHAHEPTSLIPLLSNYLPRSLPVLATIQENLSAPSTSTSGYSGGDGVLYATFPPGYIPSFPSSSSGQDVWGVVVQMRDPAHTHLRLFCSAEVEIENGPQSSTLRPTDYVPKDKSQDGSGTSGRWSEERIQHFISVLTHAIVRRWGTQVVLGSVDSRWNKSVREVVDSEEYVECTVFLAPPYFPDWKLEGDDEERVRGLGLEFDEAHDGDMDIIMSTCDVPRPREYYQSRASHTTVLRRLAEPREAVCWIMHHSDGAMGALYTLPAWRRKGLAEMVVRRRIRDRHHRLDDTGVPNVSSDEPSSASASGQRAQDHCHVFRNNKASEALWAKMGWKAGWGVRWILNSEVAKARGKVVLHRDNEEKEV